MHPPVPHSFTATPVHSQRTASGREPRLRILAIQAGSGVLLAPWLPQGLGLALAAGALLLMLTHARLRHLLLLGGGLVLLQLLQALRRFMPRVEAQPRAAAVRVVTTARPRGKSPQP